MRAAIIFTSLFFFSNLCLAQRRAVMKFKTADSIVTVINNKIETDFQWKDTGLLYDKAKAKRIGIYKNVYAIDSNKKLDLVVTEKRYYSGNLEYASFYYFNNVPLVIYRTVIKISDKKPRAEEEFRVMGGHLYEVRVGEYLKLADPLLVTANNFLKTYKIK
jgi:hypothetical protein